VSGISLGFFRRDQHGGIFQEIESATFAASAVLLPMAAGGALKRERGMAARTKFRGVWRLGAALCAFHGFILAERNREGLRGLLLAAGSSMPFRLVGRPLRRGSLEISGKTDGVRDNGSRSDYGSKSHVSARPLATGRPGSTRGADLES